MNLSDCIFCGNSPLTREDLIPRWLLRLLARNFDTKGSRKGAKGRHGASFWVNDGPGRNTVKCVCESCNGGWMSDLEVTAQPTLTRMILDKENIELDTDVQEAIATWACLKTMIAAYSWGTHPIPKDWLEYLYRNHLPPDGWYVMTTRYTGTLLQLFDTHRFQLGVTSGDQALPTGAEDKGILTTIIVGHIAIHIRALREPDTLKVRSNLLKLWPSSPLTLLWPPRAEIRDGPTLDNFRKMGVKSGPKLLDFPPR